MRAVGGASGIETTQSVYMVVDIKEGKMARVDFAVTLDEAIRGQTA